VPDPLDVLGISSVARASRLQRIRRLRAAASTADAAPSRRAAAPSPAPPRVDVRSVGDVAVDFVAMTEIVPRMRAAFFGSRP
jgi:hypothetical protein